MLPTATATADAKHRIVPTTVKKDNPMRQWVQSQIRKFFEHLGRIQRMAGDDPIVPIGGNGQGEEKASGQVSHFPAFFLYYISWRKAGRARLQPGSWRESPEELATHRSLLGNCIRSPSVGGISRVRPELVQLWSTGLRAARCRNRGRKAGWKTRNRGPQRPRPRPPCGR